MTRRTALARWSILVPAILALVLACESGDGGGSGWGGSGGGSSTTQDAGGGDTQIPTSCASDDQCPKGTLCVAQACQAVACQSAADCAMGQTCVDLDGDGAKSCALVECMSAADCDERYPEGASRWSCELGVCVGYEPQPDVVDPPADVVEDAPSPDTTPPPPQDLCQPCTADSQCGGPQDLCLPLPEGSFCTVACETNQGCPGGYLCLQVTTNSRQCVPGLYNRCADCLITGCAAGSYCNQIQDACLPVAPICGACVQDDECGPSARCYAFHPADRRCVPGCAASGDCPATATCQVLDDQHGTSGVMACVPGDGQCCFGEGCGGCACADPAAPFCDEGGACVACLDDGHCAGPAICQGGACVGPSCGGDKPYPCSQAASGCCECTEADHCGPEGGCDAATGACVASPACATCTGDYPGCAVIDGDVYCVQCSSDAHCSSGCVCDAMSYTCVEPGTSTICGAVASGQCLSQGCPSSGTYDLQCDPATGACYDAGGACDNVTAFCIIPGSECTSLTEILGGLGGIPGMPGDNPGGGSCSCSGGLGCSMGLPSTPDEICCPDGLTCMDLGMLLALLGGGSGGSASGGICMDGALLGGLNP